MMVCISAIHRKLYVYFLSLSLYVSLQEFEQWKNARPFCRHFPCQYTIGTLPISFRCPSGVQTSLHHNLVDVEIVLSFRHPSNHAGNLKPDRETCLQHAQCFCLCSFSFCLMCWCFVASKEQGSSTSVNNNLNLSSRGLRNAERMEVYM